jgi:MOSC domain-containing protein YiiM/ribosomal protein S18 acetylase RimI-like enzyme
VSDGRLVQVNVSSGGVPKRPIAAARVGRLGVEGDRQREITVHGGPHRAVSLLGVEAIRRIAAEGHPIAPGTTGENLTTEGFDVSLLPVGTRLAIGDEVVVELSGPANPCRTIRHSFADLRFGRLGVATHPADSRMYARVVREGTVRPGDAIHLEPPAGDAAERHRLAERLDRAERSSTLALWASAAEGGAGLAVVDDGEIAICAAPGLPGPIFNLGLGFASLPNLVDVARDHFHRHRASGWVWAEADAPPWPGAISDGTAAYAAGSVEGPRQPSEGDVTVRELPRDEVGAWARVVVEAADLTGPVADAWMALEPHYAMGPHDHRFMAEVDGRPVGAGALHVHHQVGWLRAGTVLPAYRGRGIQRALIAARIERARRLGCDLVGASASAGGASARNVERQGLRTVALRGRYRVSATD